VISTSLGRYRILEPLARGAMGEIYLAEDPALGRRLAEYRREFRWPLPGAER
jgi:hypothetical protein